jgi:hypothetical protein
MKRMVIAVLAVAVLAASANAQQKVDLTGTWLLQVETSAGGGSPTFTFKQTGDKLQGTYEGTFGKADVSGTVNGSEARWSFTVDVQGIQATNEYVGTVEKDTIKGTMRIGDLAEGTFTGKRK